MYLTITLNSNILEITSHVNVYSPQMGVSSLLAALLSKIDPDVYASAISYGLLLLLITSFLLLLSDRLKGDTQPDEPVADDSDSDNSTMDEEDLPLM